MLRYVEIENCFSFLNKTNLNLVVNNKAPNSNKYEKSVIEGERLTKILTILGPNGSGKSNLLRAISFLKWFLIESFGEKPDDDFPLKPFVLKEKPYAPTTVRTEFEFKAKIYRYSVKISRNVVLYEDLDVLDLEESANKERKRFKQLFSRVFNEQTEEYDFKSNPDFSLNEGIKELIKKRKDASLISAALFTNHTQSLILKDYWGSAVTKIKQFGERIYPFDYHLFNSSEFYYKNEEFKKSMEEIMSKSDLGLVGLDIERLEIPDAQPSSSRKREFFMPYGRHRGLEGKEYKLPFTIESSGTQQIYVLLSILLPALRSGGVAVVDEIEADLHPEILPKILALFLSKKTNPNGAQLIFTCHATSIMKKLDKYQTIIVQKGDEGVSHAKRLDEEDGVRNTDNLYAKYHSGEYGGLPRVSEEE